MGLSRALGIFIFRRQAQAIVLGGLEELVLKAGRLGAGGLLSVPFTLTLSRGQLLASGHLAALRGLEGHASV